MSRIVRIVAPVVALAGTAGPIAAPVGAGAPPARPTLCTAAERPVFSCPIGAKTVSVCAPRRGAAILAYRFGRPGRIELAHRGGLTLAERGYSGGGETQLSFARNGYRYVVYDRTVRTGLAADGRNEPAFDQGLVVVRGGRVVSHRRCSAESGGMDGRAVARLPRGTFVEH
jgi:hypothetical protein